MFFKIKQKLCANVLLEINKTGFNQKLFTSLVSSLRYRSWNTTK